MQARKIRARVIVETLSIDYFGPSLAAGMRYFIPSYTYSSIAIIRIIFRLDSMGDWGHNSSDKFARLRS